MVVRLNHQHFKRPCVTKIILQNVRRMHFLHQEQLQLMILTVTTKEKILLKSLKWYHFAPPCILTFYKPPGKFYTLTNSYFFTIQILSPVFFLVGFPQVFP